MREDRDFLTRWGGSLMLAAALIALVVVSFLSGCIEPAKAPAPPEPNRPIPVEGDTQLAGEIRTALGGDRQAARDYGDVLAGMAEMVQSPAVTEIDQINDALARCKEALGQPHRDALVPIFQRALPSLNPPREIDASARSQIAGEFKRFSAAFLEAAK